MSLSKYKNFLANQVFPAENANSIDPDNVAPQSAGYLNGGVNPSALAVFQSLGNGANNGKFKINVDGSVFDNVNVDLFTYGADGSKVSWTSVQGSGNYRAVRVNLGSRIIITKIKIWYSTAGAGVLTLNVRQGSNITDPIIGTATATQVNGETVFTFSTPFTAAAGDIVLDWGVSTLCYNYTSSNPYYGYNSSWNANQGINFDIWGMAGTIVSSFNDVAAVVQSAIRAKTGKTETVVYSTNKFVITSSTANRLSKILKLLAPTTGTDISGNGGTIYLDCAANATEVAGNGEEYFILRLDSNGKIIGAFLNGADGRGLTNLDKSDSSFEVLPSSIIRSVGGGASGNYGSMTKMKEIQYKNIAGVISVLFSMTSNSNNNGKARIYKNGVAVGVDYGYKTNGTYNYSEDIAVAYGDLIQIYGSGSPSITINYFSLGYLKTAKITADIINL